MHIKTDYDEVVTVGAEAGEDVVLGIVHGIGSTEAVLRPSQAERLAEALLAYANGDHKLPPNAVRPQRIVEATETPSSAGAGQVPADTIKKARAEAEAALEWRGNIDTSLRCLDEWTFAKVRRVEEALKGLLAALAAVDAQETKT